MLQLSLWGGKQIVGVVGSPLMVLGVCTLDLRFTDLVIQADFVVVDCLAVESIIGLDFLERQAVLLTYLTSFSRSGVCQFLWCMARTLTGLSRFQQMWPWQRHYLFPRSVESRLWHHAIQ